VKTPEQEAAIRLIRKLIDFWQIEPEELVVEGAPPSRAAPVAEVALKYRHPVSGETWDGQGSQPAWLKDALTRQGYTVDELRIKSDIQAGTVSPGPH
jgi:DNA-binding protein H-NS